MVFAANMRFCHGSCTQMRDGPRLKACYTPFAMPVDGCLGLRNTSDYNTSDLILIQAIWIASVRIEGNSRPHDK